MDMDKSIWGNLPVLILQRVVAFLPHVKLARFRCTNKHFKDWIYSSEFDELRGQLPVQNACLFLHTQSFFSITGSVEIPERLSQSFLTGDEEFWRTYIRGYKSKNPKLVAATGRFLFLRYLKTLAVFDLKTRTGVTLPEHQLFNGASSNALVFGGNQSTGAFHVAVLALGGMPFEPPLGIYDSVSNAWTAERFPYGLQADKIETAIVSGKLYILESKNNRWAPYNLMALTLTRSNGMEELPIEEILEDIPDYETEMVRPSLHATSSRLFMVACIKDKVLILEVNFATHQYVEVARVPERFHGMESIASTATDDCVLILVDRVKGFVYDLAPKKWRKVMMFPEFKGNGMVGKKLDIFMAA
ncbi:hypothetical protein M758_7G126000 [Ceratodon purpureus]|nr:hypothetical protein M758_7G126000 [Ceratodon purpureus]